MPISNRTPKLCRHRPSGRAFIRLNGRMIYIGSWPDSSKQAPAAVKEAYHRMLAEWEASERGVALVNKKQGEICLVNHLILGFNAWAGKRCLRQASRDKIAHELKLLRRLYGRTPAAEFGPLALMAIRNKLTEQTWVCGGKTRHLARQSVNHTIRAIKRCFAWGVSRELIPASVQTALETVEDLRRGESAAVESRKVKAAPDAYIEAVLPHLSRPCAALLKLQRLTGMRGGEVTAMRAADIDMTGPIWIYRPLGGGKTAHHGEGHERIIPLGPRAQEIIKPFLTTKLSEYLFTPAAGAAEAMVKRHAAAKTPSWPSRIKRQEKQRKHSKRRKFRPHYTTESYRKALARACIAAGVPHFSTHPVRHTRGTEVQRAEGIEAAGVVLGHKNLHVTELYVERDLEVAKRIARETG